MKHCRCAVILFYVYIEFNFSYIIIVTSIFIVVIVNRLLVLTFCTFKGKGYGADPCTGSRGHVTAVTDNR